MNTDSTFEIQQEDLKHIMASTNPTSQQPVSEKQGAPHVEPCPWCKAVAKMERASSGCWVALIKHRADCYLGPRYEDSTHVIIEPAFAAWNTRADLSRAGTEDAVQLARIERELDEAGISREVWIGTDSTADRVTWLITRNRLNQQNSRSRFTAMNALAELVETVLGMTVSNDDGWRSKAEEALVLAGRRAAQPNSKER